MAISWGRWLSVIVGSQFTPRIGLEIKAVEIIAPVRTVVPTKNVEVILESDRRMERSWTGWVHLIARGRFNLVPGVSLFKEMHIGSSDDALAIEKLSVKCFTRTVLLYLAWN